MKNKQVSSLQMKIERFKNDAFLDSKREKDLYDFLKETRQTGSQNTKNEWESYRDGYYYYKQKYESIRDASFWKMTKPLRDVSDWIRWLRTGEKKEIDYREFDDLSSGVIKMQTIGVHLHLYNEDLLDEFCRYLSHIPERFDLFISCQDNADIQSIKKRAHHITNVGKVSIKKGPNKGRDIAPFYVLFGNELLRYDILLHLHTKKSVVGEGRAESCQWDLDGVLKNERTVKETLMLLRSSKANAGLIFGEMSPSLPPMTLHWLYNSGQGRKLLDELHIKFENHMLFYPTGGFFWAKTKSIRPIFEMQMTYESFEEERGQLDGTLAHTLERVISCVVRGHQYNMYIFDPETEKFALNKSYKGLRDYFSYDADKLCRILIDDYDVISFDIFDTLVTRLVYEPKDVFLLMEKYIQNNYHVTVDYLNIRKKAEDLAWKEQGDFCNIHHIYEKIPLVSNFSSQESEKLKLLEIQLEIELCIPRQDVLKMYNCLLNAGKTIVLVSDMYLPSDIVAQLLGKCGYHNYSEIWISCDRGKRKDRNTIWSDFFEKYGKQRTIHLGDNPHSDIQIVGERERDSFLLLSPIDQFRLSKQFEKFERFLDGSPENSLVIGFLVNKYLYNSPFALKNNGISQLHKIEDVMEGIFGPIFLKFMEYLHNTSREDSTLLFLSREGYFLQKLYSCYCKCLDKKERKNFYFLTSRRATSVAQIDSYKDAKELLQSDYSGSISTLLVERFGLEDLRLKSDFIIRLPEDAYQVIPQLGDASEVLLTNAANEKKNYLRYISELLGADFDWSKAVLIDVGYSGTIQYYLMKILNQKLDGCYLATAYNIKPDLLDGTYRSLYSFWTSRMFEKTQLFLEAVTAAPHGQVINFINTGENVKVNLKAEDKKFGENAAIMQKYIYRYFEHMGPFLKNFEMSLNKELVENIFEEILRPEILGKSCMDMFMVHDGYCMDGNWIYDVEMNDWKIVQHGNEIYLKSIQHDEI